jgi:HEAT repeat protein
VLVAVGSLVSAEASAGSAPVRDLADLWNLLLAEARAGPVPSRGFALLGAGLAARPTTGPAAPPLPLRAVRRDAEYVLRATLEGGAGDPDLRGAAATGLGLMQSEAAVPLLVVHLEDRQEADLLRADAAVALALIGRGGPEVTRALHMALSERRRPTVQAGAALALSLLEGPGASTRLMQEFDLAVSASEVLRLVEPIGCFGDPALARPLVEYARSTDHADFSRALVVVALGNLGDPERRPSLGVFARDVNYPAAPSSLRGLLSTR